MSSMQQLFRYHTGKCQAFDVRPSRPSLKSSIETQTKKWNSRHSNFSDLQMPNSTTQRYNTLQKSIQGYQPQVGSDRVALIHPAVCTLGNDHVQQIVLSLVTTEDPPRLPTAQYDLLQPRPHRFNVMQSTQHASHFQLRMPLAEKQTTHAMSIPTQ